MRVRETEKRPATKQQYEATLRELMRDCETRLGRKVVARASMGKDGRSFRAELKVAEDAEAKHAHIYAVWDEQSMHPPRMSSAGSPPTEAEKSHAKDVIGKVVKKAHEIPESRFTATGGEFMGCAPLTEEQKKDAEKTAAYLRSIHDDHGLTYRTLARLEYSENNCGWEVRICPAAIKGGCDPSVEHSCADDHDRWLMVGSKLDWYGFISGALQRQGDRPVSVAFGRIHEIQGV